MAESVKGADKAKDKKSAADKKKERVAQLGHNLEVLKTKGEKGMKRLFKLQDTMDSEAAGFRSDFNVAYEEISDELGIPKKLIMGEYKRALKIKRQKEKEMMLEPSERETIEAFRTAMEGTPMGDWFKGGLAPAAKLEVA